MSCKPAVEWGALDLGVECPRNSLFLATRNMPSVGPAPAADETRASARASGLMWLALRLRAARRRREEVCHVNRNSCGPCIARRLSDRIPGVQGICRKGANAFVWRTSWKVQQGAPWRRRGTSTPLRGTGFEALGGKGAEYASRPSLARRIFAAVGKAGGDLGMVSRSAWKGPF